MTICNAGGQTLVSGIQVSALPVSYILFDDAIFYCYLTEAFCIVDIMVYLCMYMYNFLKIICMLDYFLMLNKAM